MSKSLLLNQADQPNISRKDIDKRDPISFFTDNRYTEKELSRVYKYVYDVLSNRMDNKVNRVLCYRDSDIQLAMELYDKLILDNLFRMSNVPIICSVSHNQGDFNGQTKWNGGVISIVIYVKSVSSSFKEDRKYSYNERCFDRLECILSVIRHEMIHALSRIFSNTEQRNESTNHGPLFKELFKNIFNGSVTRSYSGYDLDLYADRGKVVGKELKKGEEAQLLGRKGAAKNVIILDEPITYENTELIKYKTKGGTINETELLLFKSPEHKNRGNTKDNTLLSRISSGQFIKDDRITKTKEGYKIGLNKTGFASAARKRGIKEENIKEEYKIYNQERKDLQR